MGDLTGNIQLPGVAGVSPNYAVVSAADSFTALPGTAYMLHYKTGATTTGGSLPFKIGDPTTPIPAGSTAVAGFADVVTAPTGLLANGERVVIIDNSNRFRDSTGKINLTHQGTLTTVTVAIFQIP